MDPSHPSSATSHLLQTSTLLDRIHKGDADAVNDLFDRYKQYLHVLLASRLPGGVRGIMETHDLVQEACLRVLPYLDRFEYRGIGSFWAYIREIALNYATDIWRKYDRQVKTVHLPEESWCQPAAEAPPPLMELVKKEQFVSFEEALKILTEKKRHAVLMRLELDMDFASIARECGYPSTDAARMDVYRIIAWLGKEMARRVS